MSTYDTLMAKIGSLMKEYDVAEERGDLLEQSIIRGKALLLKKEILACRPTTESTEDVPVPSTSKLSSSKSEVTTYPSEKSLGKRKEIEVICISDSEEEEEEDEMVQKKRGKKQKFM